VAVLHHGSYSTRRTPPALRLEMYKNILRYFRRESGIAGVLCLLPILFVRLAAVNRGRSVLGLLSFDYLGR
jgi:hypothetical protein